MTYEEIFNKVKEAYENADASNVEGHIAIELMCVGKVQVHSTQRSRKEN